MPKGHIRLADEDFLYSPRIARKRIRQYEAFVRFRAVGIRVVRGGNPKVGVFQPFLLFRKATREESEPFSGDFSRDTEMTPIAAYG